MKIHVPEQFRPSQKRPYPPHSFLTFEEWCYNQFTGEESERHYLPIFFTNYYVSNGYGRVPGPIDQLQRFIDTLDKSKSYWSCLQFDDGVLNLIEGLDIKVFAPCAKRDVTIPLMCMPIPFDFDPIKKDIFASFVGRPTHPLRKAVMAGYKGRDGYYLSEDHHGMKNYAAILARSVFSLCSRGYGENSFRTSESLQLGSIPVYISDDHAIPFDLDFEEFGVIVHPKDIAFIDEILKEIPEKEIKRKQKAIPHIYKEYYTYEGCKRQMLKYL